MRELDFSEERFGDGTLCPWCGEPVEVDAEEVGPAHEELLQDCDVCCRPLVVSVTRSASELEVTLSRENG